MPPCPGMECPKSLILKPRLKPLAKKPPKGASSEANMASATACSCMGRQVKEKAATDNERKVTFLNLVPGRLYNITLWTVSGGVTSRPLERQV